MTYRTKTYIAADWDQDEDAVNQLHKWNNSNHWSLNFHDAHEITKAKDSSLYCSIKSSLQRLTKGNMINNKKMDCQPYRKRRPAVKRAAFLRDRERRKTYKETGPK